jgi:putative PIN family toxin of toxin-antitoxin system
MTGDERVVLDTNVVVSGILFENSIPAHAPSKAQQGYVLISEETKQELLQVLRRNRFDRYTDRGIRDAAAIQYIRACELVEIPSHIRACRDPRDDKFLEVAVHGRADVIVTGDDDLLRLHPFCGIAILTPAGFMNWLEPRSL